MLIFSKSFAFLDFLRISVFNLIHFCSDFLSFFLLDLELNLSSVSSSLRWTLMVMDFRSFFFSVYLVL